RLDAGFPQLRELGRGLADLGTEARPVLRHVDAEGRLGDEASPELRRLRQAQARTGERLRRLLERLIHEPGAEVVIRDEFVTQRNGRFVVPVRSDAPRPLRGIVHGSSSSGATRFVEPLETVELNNELVQLAELEQQEQERVLFAWSDAFRRRRDEVLATVEALARVDALQARALFADETEAIVPELAEDGDLVLERARHPLLDRRLRAAGGRCEPLTLRLAPFDRVLVISGPNAGGKTVALKTVGLAVLMAQSGIPVPATAARLPVYRQVRADIGDHQSIQADLSTFSAHIGAVAGFLRDSAPPALLLFDEIGTGTEPGEGAALAHAILESLQSPGITAVATTHQAPLKVWATTDRRAVSAALEFDTATLRPTYRLLQDAAGVSAGLEIAQRLGLDPRVVARARERLGPDARRSEQQLERLHELTTEAELRRDELERQVAELERQRRQLDERSARESERRAAE
ncbi:MAG TPA: hypothetical protein VJS92_15635, partial [Candidatus Polarisedimenticolaceae bacterium]|nr:hypothetical protein [Candidatus Polarisedimenticolaceae bacterium]